MRNQRDDVLRLRAKEVCRNLQTRLACRLNALRVGRQRVPSTIAHERRTVAAVGVAGERIVDLAVHRIGLAGSERLDLAEVAGAHQVGRNRELVKPATDINELEQVEEEE